MAAHGTYEVSSSFILAIPAQAYTIIVVNTTVCAVASAETCKLPPYKALVAEMSHNAAYT